MDIQVDPEQPHSHFPTGHHLTTSMIQYLQILRLILSTLEALHDAAIVHSAIERVHGHGKFDLPRDEGGDLGELERGGGRGWWVKGEEEFVAVLKVEVFEASFIGDEWGVGDDVPEDTARKQISSVICQMRNGLRRLDTSRTTCLQKPKLSGMDNRRRIVLLDQVVESLEIPPNIGDIEKPRATCAGLHQSHVRATPRGHHMGLTTTPLTFTSPLVLTGACAVLSCFNRFSARPSDDSGLACADAGGLADCVSISEGCLRFSVSP